MNWVHTMQKNGCLSETILYTLIKPIKLSKTIKIVFKLLPNKLLQLYWDSQLKKNNAIDESFAQPYK